MKNPRHIFGFSLVEVVMAVGLVSFSLLAVLGTLSVGLSTIREAAVSTSEAQILRMCSAKVMATPFKNLDSEIGGTTDYFNYDGLPLQNDDDTADRYYLASYTLAAPGYPGAPAQATNSVKTIRISIASPAAAPVTTNEYAFLLARQNNQTNQP